MEKIILVRVEDMEEDYSDPEFVVLENKEEAIRFEIGMDELADIRDSNSDGYFNIGTHILMIIPDEADNLVECYKENWVDE